MNDDIVVTVGDEGTIGQEFGIDVDTPVPAIRRHLLVSGVLAAMTQRVLRNLLAAHQLAEGLGHRHVGTEHVFLAILADPNSLPSGVLGEQRANEVSAAVREILTSDRYSRSVHLE